MSEFQVVKRVNAIIGINVNASTREEAEEKAEKELKKGLFKSNIEYLDGHEAFIGTSNMDLWNTEIE